MWLACMSRDVLAMETGGFHLDLVGMSVWGCPGGREGSISLGGG